MKYLSKIRRYVYNLEEQVRGYTKVKTPKYLERLQKLCRDGKFLSTFCPDLQKLLKPIYDLTRKRRPFIWGKEQQDSFEEINVD